MENSPVRIDLKTGRPLRTTPQTPLGQELLKRRSGMETGMSNFGGINMGFLSVSSKLDDMNRFKFLANEQSTADRTKTMGMGDDKRLLQHQFSGTRTACTPFSFFEMPASYASSIETPSHMQYPKTPCMNVEEMRRKFLEPPPPEPKTANSRLPLPSFKPPQTPSRVESEQMRRKFVDEAVKQRQMEQIQKKAVADEHLKRMATPQRSQTRPAPPTRSNSKSHRPRSRSATFIIEKADVGKKPNGHGDQQQNKKPTSSKTVSSNVRPVTMVVMNRAALLRLERFKK